MDDNNEIEDPKDALARRRAWLDQRKKQFEAQYPMIHPRGNRRRLDAILVWEFQLDMDEWALEALGQTINELKDEGES